MASTLAMHYQIALSRPVAAGVPGDSSLACGLCSAELARQEAFDNPEPVS